MIELSIRSQDDRFDKRLVDVPCLIGRGMDCNVRINHWKIAKRHVRVERTGDVLFAHDLGTLLGTFVNDKRIATHGPLLPSDRLVIGPCLIQFESIAHIPVTQATTEDQAVLTTQSSRDDSTAQSQSCTASPTIISSKIPGDIFDEMHTSLMKAFDLRKLDVTAMAGDTLKAQASRYLFDNFARDERFNTPSILSAWIQQVVDESLGLGLISELLADPTVSEIMVNRFDDVYVERDGVIMPDANAFSSEAALRVILDRIVSPLGRRLDESSPMVDARLADGSRLNAVLSPISTRGISLTVRKFGVKNRTIPSLTKTGFIGQATADYLERIVKARLNVMVSGGTGSGKTTLLNILANAIPREQRVITIEDSAELHLSHPHVVSLEARPANTEGFGAITIRDLVKNALRMRPDRLIVGEVRGAEALDMVMALNTGHDGSFTTLHSNNDRDALKRLESLILLAAPNLPLAAIKELIVSAFQVIVQIKRNNAGVRRVVSIAEIVGTESGTYLLQPYVNWDDQAKQFHYSNLPSIFLNP